MIARAHTHTCVCVCVYMWVRASTCTVKMKGHEILTRRKDHFPGRDELVSKPRKMTNLGGIEGNSLIN